MYTSRLVGCKQGRYKPRYQPVKTKCRRFKPKYFACSAKRTQDRPKISTCRQIKKVQAETFNMHGKRRKGHGLKLQCLQQRRRRLQLSICSVQAGRGFVTTAWRILRLRMEERSPIWRVAANILNKQSRTAGKVWSSSLGVGRGTNNSSP